VTDCREEILGIKSPAVLAMIRAGDPAWEKCVPPEVARIIRERKLLGCPG
jgi:hypothetical protein